jgi:SAM-dependent methyltransferase
MTSPLDFWENKHRKYNAEAWVHEPNFFAEEVSEFIRPGDVVLDLGCGQGQDALYLAEIGATVTAADFSPFALAQFEREAASAGVCQLLLDLRVTPYALPSAGFDVVYSHLSLHYFDDETTRQVFREVARVLKDEGRFFATFNSIEDEEFGTGHRLESHFFELEPGDCKRFLDEEQLLKYCEGVFRVDAIAFAEGTRKKKEDRYVQLLATRREQ